MSKSKKNKETESNIAIPRGRPKSGRIWKSNKNRFSSMKLDKPFNSTWSVKMKQRQDLKLVKLQDKALKDAKIQAKEDKRKRREENERRRAENAKKAEIVQVIKNTAKIKRMKKKQLRSIQKR